MVKVKSFALFLSRLRVGTKRACIYNIVLSVSFSSDFLIVSSSSMEMSICHGLSVFFYDDVESQHFAPI